VRALSVWSNSAHVTSFANSAGGHLMYGIAAKAGAPISLTGIPAAEVDDAVLRLEHIARDGVSPRMYGLEIQTVPLDGGTAAIVQRRSVEPPAILAPL
jgi:hypothetical protein